MPKVNKSLFTKEQWKRYKARRDAKKQTDRSNREQSKIEIVQEKIEYNLLSKNDRIGFVCGNGTSREIVNLELLRPYGKIYACNAVYRQFNPDYLVAVDTKMILEINKSGYQHNHEVWTNPNKAYTRFKNFNYFQPSKGWSSGPTALWLASQHKNDIIYILGFDYKGLDDGKKLNNLFADTPNYKKSSDSATFFGNWSRQTQNVISTNSKTKFIRVIEKDGFIPKDLANFSNLTHITVNEFIQIFNCELV